MSRPEMKVDSLVHRDDTELLSESKHYARV